MSIESNGNLLIAGFPYHSSDHSDTSDTFASKWSFFLTVDQNGKIIKKAKLHEYDDDEYISDVILANNKIIVLTYDKLKISEFEWVKLKNKYLDLFFKIEFYWKCSDYFKKLIILNKMRIDNEFDNKSYLYLYDWKIQKSSNSDGKINKK